MIAKLAGLSLCMILFLLVAGCGKRVAYDSGYAVSIVMNYTEITKPIDQHRWIALVTRHLNSSRQMTNRFMIISNGLSLIFSSAQQMMSTSQ